MCAFYCVGRATLAEITRENEFSILYGLISCVCNMSLALAQYLVGVMSNVVAIEGGNGGLLILLHMMYML